jgi:hypothetical protein
MSINMDIYDNFISNIDNNDYAQYIYNNISMNDTIYDMIDNDKIKKMAEYINDESINSKIYFDCERKKFKIPTDFISTLFFPDEFKENIFRFQYLINNSFNQMINKLINKINNYISKNYPKKKKLKETDILFLYKGGTPLKNLFDEYKILLNNTDNENFFKKFESNFKRSDSDYIIMINPNISIENNGITFEYIYKIINYMTTNILYNIKLFLHSNIINKDYSILALNAITDASLEDFLEKVNNLITEIKLDHITSKSCKRLSNITNVIALGYYHQNGPTIYKYTGDPTKINFFDEFANIGISEKLDNLIQKHIISNNIILLKNDEKIQIFKPKRRDIFKSTNFIDFSINNNVNITTKEGYINSFCLQRLKLKFIVYYTYTQIAPNKKINFKVSNFNSTGELIDVVILKKETKGLIDFYNHFNDEYTVYTYKLLDKRLNYNSYTILGHINDLFYILWTMSEYPWESIKYKIRINRLIFLLIIELYNKSSKFDIFLNNFVNYITIITELIENIQSTDNCIDILTIELSKKNLINKNLLKNLLKTMNKITDDEKNNFKLLLEYIYNNLILFNVNEKLYSIDLLIKKIEYMNLFGENITHLGGYKQKYLKYKQKYLKLKNII